MYAGWLLLGAGPNETGTNYEIVNNARASAYAVQAGICWLHDCLDCESAAKVIPGGPNYISPKDDPAPWYDADNPDTAGFLGLIGLEVNGAEGSTRKTPVTTALTGGGVVGRSYFEPRTIVVRALAIAADECSLQAGLEWFMFQTEHKNDPCKGDTFTFFDCCPCMCDDPTPSGPCWADYYRELKLGPYCTLPEGDPAHLVTTGALVESPGVRALTPIVTYLFHLKGPTTGGALVSRYAPGIGGFAIGRNDNTASVPGGMWVQWSLDDVIWNRIELNTTLVSGEYEYVALTVNRDDNAGNSVWTSWVSDDGVNWTTVTANRTYPVTYEIPPGLFADVQVGLTNAPDMPSVPFIPPVNADAELAYYGLFDGPFPMTGAVIYAFDGRDYDFTPQIPPTSWNDDYGNTWTISDPTAMIEAEPGEAGAWWPDTYAELKTGPALPDEDWCDWVDTYFELKNGLPGWSCCDEQCVVPYYRQFHNARITEGPVILRHPQMNSNGALMEVEFTLVAADPTQYGLPAAVVAGDTATTVTYSDPEPEAVAADPFAALAS